MKRILAFSLILVFCFSIAISTADTVSEAAEKTRIKLNQMLYPESTALMSTYMNSGTGAISGKWYYGAMIDPADYYIKFGKMRLSDISDITILDPEYNQYRYTTIHKGWIYGVVDNDNLTKYSILKMSISGTNKTTLTSSSFGAIQYMLVHDDYIYYAENKKPENGPITGKLYRMDLDGKNKTVILDKPVYYPSIMNDFLVYQDDRDHCRLHVCNLNGLNDRVLIDDVVFEYISDGNSIYYRTIKGKCHFDKDDNLVYPDDPTYIVKRYNLTSQKTETIIDTNTVFLGLVNGVIYYTNTEDNERFYTYDISDGSIDLMANDPHIAPVVFADNGIICKGFEVLEDGSYNWNKYFFIRYDTYDKTNLAPE